MLNFLLLMDNRDLITLIVSIIGSGGLITGIIGGISVYRKSRPEANKIIVESAQVVVGLSTKALETMSAENVKLREKVEELQKENSELRDRLDDMENRLQSLTRRTTSIEDREIR